MILSAPLPAGLILIALIVGFVIGLVVGWLAQQGLDRVLRFVAVRRAVREAVAAMRAPGTSSTRPVTPALPEPPPNLAPWYVDRTVTNRTVTSRPGMPFYRDHAC